MLQLRVSVDRDCCLVDSAVELERCDDFEEVVVGYSEKGGSKHTGMLVG